MKTLKLYGFVLLFFVILGAVVFRCGWGADQVFSGSDANIGLAERMGNLLPARFVGAYVSAPLLGEAVKASFSFSNLGQWLLPADTFADVWYAVFLVLSSVALIAYLRLWNLRWLSCVFGAVAAFWVGSVTLSAAGHIYKLGVMAFFTLSLLLVELAVRSEGMRRRSGYSLLAGLCVGFMLLEQQDVGLFAGLFLGAYTIIRLIALAKLKWLRWLAVLIPIALVALPMTVSTALGAYSRNVTEVGMKEDPQHRWNFVTQWSAVPSELPDLIAPGYAGWHTGNEEVPYWGAVGQSPDWKNTKQGFRNFRLDSLYIGFLPVFLGTLGFAFALRRIKSDASGTAGVFVVWGALALVALLLSFGKYSPLYKLFYQLPLVGNIRAPIKLLHNFQVFVGILAAFGLDHVLARDEDNEGLLKWAMRICIGFAVLMGLAALFSKTSFVELHFSDWGDKAGAISAGVAQAWFHATVMAGLLAAGLFVVRKKALGMWFAVVLLGAVAFDSVYLTSQYFKADNFAAMKRGNPVINKLKQEQGAERVYCFSQQGVYNMWVSVDFLYHDIQAFNFGQMPRMPNDYKAFLGATGNNWHRFMQLSACRYGLAPAPVYSQISGGGKAAFIKPISGFRFVREGDGISTQWIKQITQASEQVLFECVDVPPRFALFPHWTIQTNEEALAMIAAPDFSPDQELVVEASSVLDAEPAAKKQRYVAVAVESMDNRKALLKVRSETGGILRFNQRYHDGWKVLVDGKASELLKCNYINMGVYVPAGEHEVVFRCPVQATTFVVQALTIIASLVAGLYLCFWFRGSNE